MPIGTEVVLTVTGEQTGADGAKDSTRSVTRAFLSVKDGAYRFTFAERDPDSGAVTESVIEVSEEAGILERKGAVSTRMQFVPGEERSCLYGTPFGTFDVTVFTRRIAVRQVGKNFHARIRYRMVLGGAAPVECAVTVRAEPAGG